LKQLKCSCVLFNAMFREWLNNLQHEAAARRSSTY
jgi:hypothetical protein